ncbi:hypothetical protein DAPPUDRAFT_336000 [Daphnia pulex]|uniref:LIM zinc-binding domain-containing protein n=1 Tax=Daphnia pulex TaxID=6669 RepID=E9HYX4_DAPPU|nr:hypothetical protein DAPPUDRAFT_336000 [Daphnia pulex]|eukprot:EFX63052.1 hypothetical protein DAPPUDRAFT_336000 [Daphnia pulex]
MDSETDTVVLENIINLQVDENQTEVQTPKFEGKKIHVRSVDAAQVQQKSYKVASDADATTTLCKLCNKQVFQMESVKAEKLIWHNHCFKCTECQKNLTVDTYNSHEGLIYCKPHSPQPGLSWRASTLTR